MSAFLLTILVSECLGQKILNNREFIEQLLAHPGLVTDIYLPPTELSYPIEITDIPFIRGRSELPQTFLKTSKGLFVLVDGTGRVYEIRKHDGILSSERLDSTIFTGYNFGAISFAHRDTLYSYGGYGFWHYNGQLRVYISDKHEWELKSLSREIPIQIANPRRIKAWFDSEFGQLYVNRMPDKALVHDSIYVLDIQKRTWKVLGKNIMPFEDFTEQIETPWGILCRAFGSNQNNIYLLDFRNNQIRLLDADKSQEINMRQDYPSYFSDSTLFTVKESLFAITLSSSDFTAMGASIYGNLAHESLLTSLQINLRSSWKVLIGIIVGLCIGLVIANKRRKTTTTTATTNLQKGPDNVDVAANIFDAKEKDLIRLIFDNSSKNIATSIDDINRILGLLAKPNDLQKKHRSDTITAINKKFMYFTHSEKSLIKKHRSEVDKRSFEFYIDLEDYKMLNNHI